AAFSKAAGEAAATARVLSAKMEIRAGLQSRVAHPGFEHAPLLLGRQAIPMSARLHDRLVGVDLDGKHGLGMAFVAALALERPDRAGAVHAAAGIGRHAMTHAAAFLNQFLAAQDLAHAPMGLLFGPVAWAGARSKRANARGAPEALVACAYEAQSAVPLLDLAQQTFRGAPRHGEIGLRGRVRLELAGGDHDAL